MQLNVARLCLDCEYLHDARRCPMCASGTFAYMTRWCPATYTRQPVRRVVASSEAPTNLGRNHRRRWSPRCDRVHVRAVVAAAVRACRDPLRPEGRRIALIRVRMMHEI